LISKQLFTGVFKRYALIFVVLLALTLGIVFAVEYYRSELIKFGLAKAVAMSGGRLTMSQPTTSPLGGVTVASVGWKDEKSDVKIDGLRINPSLGLQSVVSRSVVISALTAESVNVVLPPSTEPMVLPANLTLPISLVVGKASVKRLKIEPLGLELHDLKLSGSYSRDSGKYELSEVGLVGHGISYQGKANLKDLPPFSLNTNGQFETSIPVSKTETWPVALKLDSQGTLEKFQLNASGKFRELAVKGVATVQPFEKSLLSGVRVNAEGFDLAKWLPQLKAIPNTLSSIEFTGEPFRNADGTQEFLAWEGTAILVNRLLGKVDESKLPFERISGQMKFDLRPKSTLFRWAGLDGKIPGVLYPVGGELEWQSTGFTSHLTVKAADASVFFAGAPATNVTGHIDVRGSDIYYQLKQGQSSLNLEGKAANVSGQWRLTDGKISTPTSPQQVKWLGEVNADKTFAIQADLSKLDAAQWTEQFNQLQLALIPDLKDLAGQLNRFKTTAGGLVLDGKLRVAGKLGKSDTPYDINFDSVQTQVRGESLLGILSLALLPSRSGKPWESLRLDTKLQWRGATLSVSGASGSSFLIEASSNSLTNSFKELLASPVGRLDGPVSLQATVSGDLFTQPEFVAAVRSPKLVYRSDKGAADIEANEIDLTVKGNARNASNSWTVDHVFNLNFLELGQKVVAAGGGRFDTSQSRWQGVLNDLSTDGKYNVKLNQALNIDVSPDRISTGKSSLSVDGGRFDLSSLTYSDEFVELSAQTSNLPIERILYWAQTALPKSLQKIAGWKVSADVNVKGKSLETLNGNVDAILEGDGVLPSKGRVIISNGQLSGAVDLAFGSFASLSQPLGPEWRVDGELQAKLLLSGKLTAPIVNADLIGKNLILEQKSLGWKMRDGEVKAKANVDSVTVESMSFNVGEGSLKVTGQQQFGSRTDSGQFALVANKVSLPLSPEQRIVLSGTTQIAVRPKSVLWTGKLTADEGLIELRNANATADPADVVITRDRSGKTVNKAVETEANRPATAPAAQAFTIAADLQLDLGQRIKVVGTGVDARLQGVLNLKGTLPEAPRVIGTVNVVNGTYVAYGQRLDIDRGRLIFNGAFDNPTLDIVALRKRQPVEAGVSLAGTALNPKIKLVSIPDVPDSEKLSWLVLGVGIENNRDNIQNAAMQAAAATLLGEGGSVSNSVAKTLGLDVLSLRTTNSNTADAPVATQGLSSVLTNPALTTTQQNVVTVGKRLSSRLYVSYEQGLRGVWNLLRIQYDISNRLSLRAHAGSESAVDLLLFHPFD
jgi:translocation and assembly module TamB